jgi:hypothetical protein
MRPKKIWTVEEDDALRELYLDYTNKELADACGVEKSTIAKRLTHLGLSRMIPAVTLDGERWKKFKNAPMYSVSNFGRVRNDKTLYLVRPILNETGYLQVNISVEEGAGKMKLHTVHRMVAETFLKRDEGIELFVNHIDGNKQNNFLSNLEWVTPSENTLHAPANGLSKSIGETHGMAKYDEKTIHAICLDLQSTRLTNVEIARKHGIGSKGLVSSIRCRIAWKHISRNYQW